MRDEGMGDEGMGGEKRELNHRGTEGTEGERECGDTG
jgi:hypothetical protein